MCFMAIDELDKVNSNISYDDLALITRKLSKYMRGESFRGRRFTSRRAKKSTIISH